MAFAAVLIAQFRELATEKGLEWSQLKAAIIAQIKDDEDGGDRLEKLTAKADKALTYAVALQNKLNSENPQRTPPVSSTVGGIPGDTFTNSKPVAAVPSRSSSDGEATGSSPVASSNSQSVAVTLPGDSDGESASPINPSIPDTPDRAALSTIPTDDPYNCLPAFLERARQVLS